MPDFIELPIYGGYGDYHLNRYRIAFSVPAIDPWSFMVSQARQLRAKFPFYIGSPYATAEWGEHKFGKYDTIRFVGAADLHGINITGPHSDWVAIEHSNFQTFTAQTLQREFMEAGDMVPVPVAGLRDGLSIGVSEINSMHFLAGRRAWLVSLGRDFGLADNIGVLETVACERFSHQAYAIADEIIGLEKRLPAVWLAFLDNFIKFNSLESIEIDLKPGWKKFQKAAYVQHSFPELSGLLGDPEYREISKLYLDILP